MDGLKLNKAKFALGDVVALKSGGPNMTVVGYSNNEVLAYHMGDKSSYGVSGIAAVLDGSKLIFCILLLQEASGQKYQHVILQEALKKVEDDNGLNKPHMFKPGDKVRLNKKGIDYFNKYSNFIFKKGIISDYPAASSLIDGHYVYVRYLNKNNKDEEFRVAENHLEHLGMEEEINSLSCAMKNDLDYAWSWHCNIVMSMVDEGCDHDKANRGAARFMQMAFGVDITKCEQYTDKIK